MSKFHNFRTKRINWKSLFDNI